MSEFLSVTLTAMVDTSQANTMLTDVTSRLEGIATSAVQEMANTTADMMLAAGASAVEVTLTHMESVVHVGSIQEGVGRGCRVWQKPGCYPQVVHSLGRFKPKALGTIHGPFFRVCHPYPKHRECDVFDELDAMVEEVSVTVSAGIDP